MPKLKIIALDGGPAVLWMAAIFVVSGTPGSDLPGFGSWDYAVKKTGHVLAYALLAALLRRAVGWQRRLPGVVWLLAFAYALLDEFHQSFVPGRHPSLIDALAFDGAGAAAALWISWRFLPTSTSASSDRPKEAR
jgi:VanZ family protein